MKVRGLILVLLIPWFVHAEDQYYGTRIASLALVGTDSDADLRFIRLRVGDTITPENVREALQGLYDTGRYSQVEVDATPAPEGGTNVAFRVQPNFFFGTFRIEPESLLERQISGYVRLPLGEKFTKSAVDRIVQETVDLLKAEGYFEATVAPEYNFDNVTRLVSVTLRTESGPKATIGNIRVQGGEQTFRPEELLKAFDLKPGKDFSAREVDSGTAKIRSKFTNLGFLNTRVTVDRTYISSTHSVDLNVTIQTGQFTLVQTRGYDISTRKLRDLVPIYEEGTVDQDLVEEGTANIDRYMQQEGYFEATVSSETIEAPLDNAIQINYTIMPGVRHLIESVTIQGNTYFSEKEIRRRIKVHKGALFNRGVFSKDLLDEDVQTIQVMYRNAGFQKVEVRGSYEENAHVVAVLIQIQEGTQLPVDLVKFEGNDTVNEQELRKRLVLREGSTYTPAAVDQARATITQMYYSKGYPDVRVEPIVERYEGNNGMSITFRITEGDAYKIGTILVGGNTLTAEKIIHRNSNLYPNTPYNPQAILDSQQRLYATGLFTRVEIVTLQQNLPGIRNLLIQVEDAHPILVTYGVGYQEWERARGTVDISHTNLFGLDRTISLRIRGSGRERLVGSTYREPKLFNHDLDGYASAFVEHSELPSYTANQINFSLQVLKRFSPQHTFLVTSSYQTVNLADILVNPLANQFPDERGIIQIGSVSGSSILDRRNDPINPSTGSFTTTTFQVANRVLGSEVNFTSLFNQYSTYSPVPGGVLATSFRFGWNQPYGPTKALPINLRYFAGGSTTLRGFSFDEAEPDGGNILTIGNVEYRVPLPIFPITGIVGALFYDTGNVFARWSNVDLNNFTHTVGFGLRYQTPLGPVRLDFGFLLKPKTDAIGNSLDRFKVFFTLGNPF
jgi:outer membrane protein insertion porin family